MPQRRVDEEKIELAEDEFTVMTEQRPATEEEIKEAEREQEVERQVERQRPATEEEIKEAEKDK